MIFLKMAFIYIQKACHFSFRDVYIYKKPNTSKKARQFELRCFMHKKTDTLRYAIFMEFLKLAEVGGHFYKQKTMHFALNLYMQKTIHFTLRFYIQKALHFASHFYMQKM